LGEQAADSDGATASCLKITGRSSPGFFQRLRAGGGVEEALETTALRASEKTNVT